MILHLMVLCTMLMIITSATISGISWFNRLILNAEICHLQSVCFYLQKKALRHHYTQTLTINPSNNRYHYDNTENLLSPQIQFGSIPHIKGPPAHPTHLITTPCTFAHNTLSFYPNGTACAGTLYMTNNTHTIQSALTIGVSPITYIRTYRYNGHWKLIS